MDIRLRIPQFTSKDLPIMLGSMLILALLINYNLFEDYFSNPTVFLWATAATFIFLIPVFICYGIIAISLRNRFPSDRQNFARLSICISVFVLLSAVVIALLLITYDTVHFLNYSFAEKDYTYSYLVSVVMNIFLTFLNEGISQFEKYKTTLIETEQLKKEYLHSQLLGLKSQMNPHFLFNSLNTLSSLIQEDAEKAEDFLDHMSKVYRYLLRNNDEHLVNLKTEIDMVTSYYFLLKKRHGDALNLSIDIPKQYLPTDIPPLTLQMLIENSVNQNILTKNQPLNIFISVAESQLQIKYNLQPKLYGTSEDEEAIENIANKFRLLTQREIGINEYEGSKIISLPLVEQKEFSTV